MQVFGVRWQIPAADDRAPPVSHRALDEQTQLHSLFGIARRGVSADDLVGREAAYVLADRERVKVAVGVLAPGCLVGVESVVGVDLAREVVARRRREPQTDEHEA